MMTDTDIQRARDHINQIREHGILGDDFDGVLGNTERPAAEKTVELVNQHLAILLGPDKFEPLTPVYVYTHLSGRNFKEQQIPEIESLYGIKFPAELVAQKEAGNLAVLSTETQSITGAANGLRFVEEYCLNSIGVTQSNPARVKGTLGAPGCQDIRTHITQDLDEGLCKGSHKTLLLSAGDTIHWNGEVIPKLPSKPKPDGYNLAYRIAASRIPEFKDASGNVVPVPMMIFEDSDTGAQAAVAATHVAKVGIVALGSHMEHDVEGHVSKMKAIIGEDKSIVLRPSANPNENPWIPGFVAFLDMCHQHARATTAPHLPEKLPSYVVELVRQELNRDFGIQPAARPAHVRHDRPFAGLVPSLAIDSASA